MFQFNFQLHDTKTDNFIESKTEQNQIEKKNINCEEIKDYSRDCWLNYNFKSISIENLQLYIRDIENTDQLTANENFLSKYKSCDVIPNVYEGGFKLWECTYDLLLYLIQNRISFKGKTVLDLGCGSGLLGIYAALNDAKIVHFQDFNSEVLNYFTIPNVLRNSVISEVKFITGDWTGFSKCDTISDTLYDLILTSEIIYKTNTYNIICELFLKHLHKNGVILLASKSYYFGVGGSIKEFERTLSQKRMFNWKIVWNNSEGVRREIMQIEVAEKT